MRSRSFPRLYILAIFILRLLCIVMGMQIFRGLFFFSEVIVLVNIHDGRVFFSDLELEIFGVLIFNKSDYRDYAFRIKKKKTLFYIF